MNNGGGGAAPTGCYKCGRPGHWSRDCPSDPTTTGGSNNSNSNPDLQPDFDSNSNTRSRPPIPTQKQKQKPPRRTRPKLTPDLLLSDAGIGHILRYFPRALKCRGRGRGRGHEVNDLQNLLRLYAEWHSRLLPYYSFDQFIHKVEQVGSTKRVKMCLRQLQERVANGIDPTKLHEPKVEQTSIDEQDAPGGLDVPSDFPGNNVQQEDGNNIQEDMMPQDMWEKAMEEGVDMEDACRVEEERAESSGDVANQNQMSEEQKARMEANRLKALERAAARSRAS